MPYFGTLVDTLLVDGDDIQAIPGVVVESLDGLLADAPYRGDNLTLPGRPGEIGVAKVRGAYTFDVLVALVPDDEDGATATTEAARRAQFLVNLDALRALFPTNLVTLTRRLTTADGYADSTCNAEYVPDTAFVCLNPTNGRTVLQFVNLDGGWTPEGS